MRLNLDSDRDGVPNWRDCNPWNPNEQGKIHDYLQAKKMEKAEKILKKVDEKEAMTPHVYLIVKIKNGKWENWGAYTRDKIKRVIYDAKRMPNVEQVSVSNNPKLADQLNRQIMIKQVKKVAKKIGKGTKTVGKGVIGGTLGAIKEVSKSDSKGVKGYVKDREFAENLRTGLTQRRRQPIMYTPYQPRERLRETSPTIQIFNAPASQQPISQRREYYVPRTREKEEEEKEMPVGIKKPFGLYKPPVYKF